MIAATMTLDATMAATALRHGAAARFGDALRQVVPPLRAAAASRLLLFVGMAPSAELRAMLAPDGMRCLSLPTAAAAVEAARLARFDAVVVRGAALGASPSSTLPRLRSTMGCPLLVWAEPDDEVDEIGALEHGADAWLRQPMAPRRVRAHLLARLRSHAVPLPVPLEDRLGCPWRIDRVHNRLHVAAARPVALTDAQAALLQRLVDGDGRVVPRAQLAEALMPSHGHALQARSIDVYVHRLRARLRGAGVREYDIEAVRGRGYRLWAPTSTDPAAG